MYEFLCRKQEISLVSPAPRCQRHRLQVFTFRRKNYEPKMFLLVFYTYLPIYIHIHTIITIAIATTCFPCFKKSD